MLNTSIAPPFRLVRVLLTSGILTALTSTGMQAYASNVQLSIEIPRLQVAEYHRPYVAVWISDARQQRVADIAIWYDTAMARDEGTKWLPDLRQWWRRSGRSLEMPVDGVSGATRPVGNHQIIIPPDVLNQLNEGEYIVHVEAAREVGGREHIQLHFSVDAEGRMQAANSSKRGEHELGRVTLTL